MGWFDKITTFTGGVKNLVVIALIVYAVFAFNGWKNDYKALVKSRLAYEQLQAEERRELQALLKRATEANQRLAAQVAESKTRREEIRMDVGKSIRTLNRSVKELKSVEDPKESFSRLSAAWVNN